ELQDGSRVFLEGDEAEAVYVVVGGPGRIRIATIDKSSKGLMIEVFGVGDLFGEIAVLDGCTRSADAIAEGRVRVLRIGRREFLEAINRNAALGANLCLIFARHVRRTTLLFRDATFESLEVRLGKLLLYLASRDGRRTEQGLQLAGRFRQGDLADLLG